MIIVQYYCACFPPGPNDHYDYLLPASPPTSDSKPATKKDTSLKDRDRRYEGLLPRRDTKESLEEADADTYVYMAPWKDFQRSSSVPVESSSDRWAL